MLVFNPFTATFDFVGEASESPVWGSITGDIADQTDLQNAIPQILSASGTLYFGSTASFGWDDQNISVPGALPGDAVAMGFDFSSGGIPPGGLFFAWASTDFVTVRYYNGDASNHSATPVIKVKILK